LALNQFIGGTHQAASQQLSAQGLERWLHARGTAFHGCDTSQSTFIVSHDQMRTLVRFHKLGITNDTERQRRMDLATVLLLTVSGMLIIFYGDEQSLSRSKDCEPRLPEFRQVDPEDVNGHDDDPYSGLGMTEWSEETTAFKIIAILANLHRQSPAIAQGEYGTLYADQDNVMFERCYQQDVVIVAINRGDDQTITLQTGIDVTPDS